MAEILHLHDLGEEVDLLFPHHLSLRAPYFATSLSAADNRYWISEVAAFLAPVAELAYWMTYEIALAKVVENAGLASDGLTGAMIEACTKVTPELHAELEAKGSHNIDALRKAINTFLPTGFWPYTHFAATSFDAISSAMAMQLRDFTAYLIGELYDLVAFLGQKALEWRQYPQIGRTHLQHAAPIVLGYWLAEYVDRLTYEIGNLKKDSADLKGKYSGFVGVYGDQSIAFDDPVAVEGELLGYLHLAPARYSNQIVPFNRTNRLIQTMIAVSGTLSDLANDLRLLLMTEVAEFTRPLDEGETGSSVGSHKVNPSQVETVAGLNRFVCSLSGASHANLESNLQRDLRDSSGTRFVGDLGDYVVTEIRRQRKFIGKLEPNEERMLINLGMTKNQIMAPAWNTMLRKYGHLEAHESTKALAAKARKAGEDFVLMAQHEYADYFDRMTPDERRLVSNPELYTGLADQRTVSVVVSCLEELGLPAPQL